MAAIVCARWKTYRGEMGPAAGGQQEVLAQGRPLGRDRDVVRAALIAAAVGVLVGGGSVHAWDGQRHTPLTSAPVPSPSTTDGLAFSLGYQTGALVSPGGASAVVALSVVVTNTGNVPETVNGIDVSGPGASLVSSPAGGPATTLPQVVQPGRSVKIRFGIASTCSLSVRPLPTVSWVIDDQSLGTHSVQVAIPDLDAIWGLTLVPPACGLS